jgi:hypothetical protein
MNPLLEMVRMSVQRNKPLNVDEPAFISELPLSRSVLLPISRSEVEDKPSFSIAAFTPKFSRRLSALIH